MVTDEKKRRGRRPDSDELRAAKRRLREAKTDDARATAQAEVDAVKARERATKTGVTGRIYTEDELFDLLAEHEPRIRDAEEAQRQAADRVKAEREVLAKAFGGLSAARKRLALFRRALTQESEAEARELIEMRKRVAARQNENARAAT